jgi:hypothetical protein
MQTVEKLFTNSTNRLPLIPEPFLPLRNIHHNNKINAKYSK